MKQCTRCKTEKALDEFYHRKTGIHAWCKVCVRDDNKKFYKRNPEPYKKRARACHKEKNKERIAEANLIKAQIGCQCCNEKTVCVLDFHHLVGNSKGKERGMPVSRAACQSEKAFRRELSKCIVVCANCHRKIHAGLIVLPESITTCS